MGALMRKYGFTILAAILGISSIPSVASEDSAQIEIRTSGYLMIDGGYISETEDAEAITWMNEPFGSLIGGLRISSKPSERLRLTLNPELKSHNIFPIRPGEAPAESKQRTQYQVYLEEAKAAWTFGDIDHPRAGLEFGYLIYTDNPDAKVLGNYLFRSMVYPGLLFTKMDNNSAYLLGLHGGMDFLDGKLKNHLFVLSEVQNYPYYDIHVAYSGSFTLGNYLEIGAGFKYNSLIPIRPSRTTPQRGGQEDNTYKFVPFQPGTIIKNDSGGVIKTVTIAPQGTDSALVTITDAAGNPEPPLVVKRIGNGIAGLSTGRLGNKVMGNLTAVGDKGDLYPELHGTSTPYSYAGLILGGRVTLNPMAFLGETNPLGKDAFKLYSEIAILGWKNYPGFYENRGDRQPMMVGINLPTFNYMDFISFEVEKYKSRELPTSENRSFNNVPQPGTHKGAIESKWDEDRRTQDDLKWVLTAKRTFRRWGIVVQGGTDHTKLIDISEQAIFDVMSRPSQWYTEVRFFAGVY